MKTALLASLLLGLTTALACGSSDSSSGSGDGGNVSCPEIEAGACISASGQCATLSCTNGQWVCPSGYTEVGACGTLVDSGADAATDSGACTNVSECPNIPVGSEGTCHYGPPVCVNGINQCGDLICTNGDAGDDASSDASVGCTYTTVSGTFKVTAIANAPSTAETCGTSPQEVTLSFTADAGSADAGDLETAPGRLVYVDGSSDDDVPAACLTRLGVTVGDTISGTRRIETSGTCDPFLDSVNIDLSTCCP